MEMNMDNNRDEGELTMARRNELLYSAIESDVKFVFRTGSSNLETFVYAHKRILSIGSCVFDRMFNGLMSDSSGSNSVITIPDIPIDCFRNLLMFIYIGAVELNLGNSIEVMYAAHKYQVCRLESLCCDLLYTNMDVTSVFRIYELTRIFNNNITVHCLQWIDDLFGDLAKRRDFTQLKKATLMELLKRNTLNIREVDLFKAVYRWAEKQCDDASIAPNDANLRAAVDNFKLIRFPTMKFEEFAECIRYGPNILTPEEKLDVCDALSGVKSSAHFNSTKRIDPPMSYKAFTFSFAPAKYVDKRRYTFEFRVNRIVHLTCVTVIRNCLFLIYEKRAGDANYIKTKECVVHLVEPTHIKYTFVPNVTYVFVTVESFQCTHMGTSFYWTFKCLNNQDTFKSYAEMDRFYNRIAKIESWNFPEHDPFVFTAPQTSLIRVIAYKTSKNCVK